MLRSVMGTALVLAALGAAPRPVQAHAILIESDPPTRADVPSGPVAIRLRFNSRIDQARSRIELRRAEAPSPTAKPLVAALTPAGPDTLAGTTTLPPGAWVLRWQVLAVDGHITRGDVPFTVTAP